MAALLLAATLGVYFYEPADRQRRERSETRSELESTIAKASTYYEFGHYERAVESYELAIERGMQDALEWFQYAHAVELSGSADLRSYVTAYGLLLEQHPGHDYVRETEAILAQHSHELDYELLTAGEMETGTLVELTGTVSRVVWGRVETTQDTLIVATRENEWIGHSGDEIMVQVPRHRRYRPGDTLSIVGFYVGWCTRSVGTGPSREYPCVEAAGARLVSP